MRRARLNQVKATRQQQSTKMLCVALARAGEFEVTVRGGLARPIPRHVFLRLASMQQRSHARLLVAKLHGG